MEQTAVEWLVEELELTSDSPIIKNVVEQSKQIEKEQKNKLAIDFYKWICSEKALDLIQDLQIVGELNKKFTTEELLEIFKKEKGL